jgi:hypothetical protein
MLCCIKKIRTWRWRCRVMRIFRTEKALPEEAAVTKLESDAQSSLERWSVLETRIDIAANDNGSTLIQVGRALWENI